ncbi:BON domain-containing protein [Rickettsia endosymbiont of Urophora cardui]|uniref:BON domain-containing protein n=1 Tax=Rickettsia endosymbiont of Urophora cardui TaxID=3066265 RepID=UPI00313D865F
MVSNGKLYTKVMEKLRFEPRLDDTNITVAIKGNHDIVVLGGTVKTFVEKSVAENAVKSIAGIRGVVDEIKVDATTMIKRSDVEIAEEANKALKSNLMIPDERIKIIVEDGYITLSGEVEWQYQRNAAVSAVRNLGGVKSVINNIIVKASANIDAHKVKEQITKEFERHARIDASKIQVKVEGKTIVLKGAVRNFDEMDEAVDAAWSIPGVENVNNDLLIA